MLNNLANLDGLPQSLAIIGAQLATMAVVFAITGVMLRLILSRAGSLPVLKKFKGRTESGRKSVNKWLILLFIFLSLVLIGGNAYLMYQNVDILEYGRNWVEKLGPDFWVSAALGFAKVIGLFVVAQYLVCLIEKGLMKLMARAKAYKNIKANDESIEVLFSSLNRIQLVSVWLIVTYFATRFLFFPAGAGDVVLLALKVYLIVAFGQLALKAIAALVASLDALSTRYREPENFLGLYEKLHGLIPLLRRSLEAVIYVIMATLVMMQMDFVAPFAKYGPPLIESIGVFFLARVVVEVSNLLIDRSMLKDTDITEAERQSQLTIVPIFKSFVTYAIYFIAFVLILRALSLNPLPILAGAGVVGIVIGLGAQPLINDVVSGLFILFEKLYLIGDFIEAGAARGMVESIELRTTRIRSPDGQLHIVRNGQLAEVVNFSKGYTFATVEVGVAYDSNLDHVYDVLRKAGEELKNINTDVLEATEVLGLDNFGESELTIRTLTRVKPARHAEVARQYRKLVKDAFDREGIEIPFARRVMIFKNQEESRLLGAA